MTDPKSSAFPSVSRMDVPSPGLNKREYLAGLAMQALIIAQGDKLEIPVLVARDAVKYANALIKELSQD